MARRFKKKAGLGALCLPGVGGLGNDAGVEGEEYARFCPAVLEEVFGEAPAAKPKPAAKKAAAAPPPPPDPEPEDEEPEDEDEEPEGEPEPPNMGWRRDELVEYAEGLGLEVHDKMTKRDILKAIEDEEE